MTDTVITLPRSAVEQALDMFERGRFANKDVDELEALCDVLRAALEQPQGKQESAAEVGVIGWKNHLPNSETVVHWTALMPPLGTKLYTHPQPPRQPLTDEQCHHICAQVDAQQEACAGDYAVDIARAIERAHDIGGEK